MELIKQTRFEQVPLAFALQIAKEEARLQGHLEQLSSRFGGDMERTYDIFEKMNDGAIMWRCAIQGHQAAIQKLQEAAAQSSNEFQLMHLPTKTVIATINTPKT